MNFHENSWRKIPGFCNLHTRGRENLKSQKFKRRTSFNPVSGLIGHASVKYSNIKQVLKTCMNHLHIGTWR